MIGTVPGDLEAEPGEAAGLRQAAHGWLVPAVADVTDEQARSPSRLPGVDDRHVHTHLARNAGGRSRPEGAPRPAADIIADLVASQRRLELAWERSAAAGWTHREVRGDERWPTTASPGRRLREVEMHYVDLGLGYEPCDWPGSYVAWELPRLPAPVPSRLQQSTDAHASLAWLSGRAGRTKPPILAGLMIGQQLA